MMHAVCTSRSRGGVDDRRLGDQLVQGLDRHLAGDERRGPAGAILADLEQVTPRGADERGEAPVVDHEQDGLGQAGVDARVGAIAAGDVQL